MPVPQQLAIPVRLQRSVLSVPGINPRMFDKAIASDADYVMLDCEDSVAPADKPQARLNVIEAVRSMDWHGHGKTVMVRINPPDTSFMYRDIVEIFEAAGEYIDCIMVPKVNRGADIYMVDTLLRQVAWDRGWERTWGIEALVETAQAMVNIEEIAASSPRLEALHFGAGDFAASCRARTVSIGGLDPDYPGDPWHYAMQRIAVTCRAFGLRPIDSAYGDFSDSEGYIASARRAAAIGFEGKWAIHPAQIPLANEVMSPLEEEVERARRVLQAMEQAEREGQGAARLDGVMVDIASVKMAQNIVTIADQIAARGESK